MYDHTAYRPVAPVERGPGLLDRFPHVDAVVGSVHVISEDGRLVYNSSGET
jgi:hypothetical protein